jgi:hypothetical protein
MRPDEKRRPRPGEAKEQRFAFEDHHHAIHRPTARSNRHSEMDMRPEDPIVKPAIAQRERLPNRRSAETLAFDRDNLKYQMTVGHYPDGRIGEVFLNAEHANSLLDVLAHDAAILASLALQFGCPLDTIRHAIKRDAQGVAASPIGEALDRIEP